MIDHILLFAYLRIITYFLTAIVFSILSFLYYYGYKNVKTSRIIKTLRNLFISLTSYFLILGISVFMRYRGDSGFEYFNLISIIPALTIFYFANRFIKDSLEEEKMKLPNTNGGERK